MSKRRCWLHTRAALIALHLAAILLLSLPGEGLLGNPQRWSSPTTAKEMATWADTLTRWGTPTTGPELTRQLQGFSERYLAVRRKVLWPFLRYESATGATQSWGMFASPRRVPTETVVEIREHGQWRTLFVPRSGEYNYRAAELEHNRVRKLFGRFGRSPQLFDAVARWIAVQALRDHPEADHVRVTLYEFDTLPPERVREGHTAKRRKRRQKRYGRNLLSTMERAP